MSDRWRPNFDAEFREQVQKFLDENESIPYSDPREFVQAVAKNKIMDFEEKKLFKESAEKYVEKDLDSD